MYEDLIDFGFLEELSGGDPKYKYDVLEIFTTTADEGLDNLGKLVKEGKDYESLFKQAHALKSSAGIIKVKEMHPRLQRIEELGRNIYERGAKEGQEEIESLYAQIMETYEQARPVILKVMAENKPTE